MIIELTKHYVPVYCTLRYACFSLAQDQQYDEDGIMDIFRQYGDHLYG